LLVVEKILFLKKRRRSTPKNTREAGISATQKIPKEHEFVPVTFVGGLYNTYAVLCSKICRYSGNRSAWRLDLKICLFSENFPIFNTFSAGTSALTLRNFVPRLELLTLFTDFQGFSKKYENVW